MLLFLQGALGMLSRLGLDPSLLHVNLQIRSYIDPRKYVGTKDSEVGVVSGRNLEMNCRIHETGSGAEKAYSIFVDGSKICHIDGVVRRCGSNSSEAQEWGITPFPAKTGSGPGYAIRAQEDGAVHCMTRRDGERNSLVMEPCVSTSEMQRWDIGFDGRTEALRGTFLGSLDRQGSPISGRNWKM